MDPGMAFAIAIVVIFVVMIVVLILESKDRGLCFVTIVLTLLAYYVGDLLDANLTRDGSSLLRVVLPILTVGLCVISGRNRRDTRQGDDDGSKDGKQE